MSAAEEKIKVLEVENEDYKEANTLIRKKYEGVMSESPQLRVKQLESLFTEPAEECQAQIQINSYHKKY